MKTLKLTLTATIIALLFSSCFKNNDDIIDDDDQDQIINSVNDLQVPENFDWKTTQTIDVVVTLPESGEIQPLIITNYDGSVKYFKGYPDDGSRTLRTKITIPAYISDLRFIYNGTNGPNIVYIGGSMVEYNFNNTYKSTNDDDYCCDGQVTNLELEYIGDVTSPSILVTGKHGNQEPELYNEDNVTEPFEFEGANNNNKMGPKIKVYVNGVLNVEIHTSCSVPIYVGQTWGDFVIISGESGNVDLCPLDNPPPVGDPEIEVEAICLGTEVLFTIENNGDGDMTDNYYYTVFKNDVEMEDESGSYELVAGETKDVTVSGLETDIFKIVVEVPEQDDIEKTITGCGVSEPPIDPPTEQFGGTLAYEDLWPGKGDYDFNDLVIDYDFEITKNNQEKVQDISVTFTVKAFGAAQHNGFGFTIPSLIPGDIASVNGYDIDGNSVFDIAGNGTEQNQSLATFIVFDDVRRIMPQTTPGVGVNTELQHDFIDPVTIQLNIELNNNNITFGDLDIGSFNPFIVVNTVIDGSLGVRGREVHLPDYEPTDLFDVTYFGQFEDASDQGSGKYFVTGNNLPWAINIAEGFDWVIEKQDITGAYNNFAEWAQSGGINFADWYQNNTGYRNDNLIYPTQKNQ